MATVLEQAMDLSIEEKLELISALWDSMGEEWRQEADNKLRESLAEYKAGKGTRWKKGDCERMARELLQRKKTRRAGRS